MSRPKGIEEIEERNVETDRPAMWTAMRFVRRFTCAEISTVTGAKTAAVLQFVMALARVGVVQKEANHGSPSRPFATYRLAIDLGPKTPICRRVWTVFDPNSKKQLERVKPIQEES